MISTIPLFHTLSEEITSKIAEVSKLHYYKKGTVIFDLDKAPHYFIYAVKGWVKLSRAAADGSEVIIDVFDDQHYAGETFLLDEKSSSYAVDAISDLELIVIPIQRLKELTLKDHSLTLAFLKATLNKQNKLTMEVEHLSIKTAMQRLGCFLLRLCTLQKQNDITIKLPYDKSLLALRLGIRPETFSRALSKMCDEYNIQVKGDVLNIESINNLASHACRQCSKTFPCKDIMQ